VGRALFQETGEPYKGILYGGFMLTKDGLRVIEYNARFGDPEVMNILSLLETDFIEICKSIIDGTLDNLPVTFRNQASVCKYIVPSGYPNKSAESVGSKIELSEVLQSEEFGGQLRLYYGAVNQVDGGVELTDSRSLAFVGIADSLAEAEVIAEKAASSVKGPVFHRRDIGTATLVQKRVDHMHAVWQTPLQRRIG
jgi:phosphoribosylamine-glycine ligase